MASCTKAAVMVAISCQVRVYWSHCVEFPKLHEPIGFANFVLLDSMYNNEWRELWRWLRVNMSCRAVSNAHFLLSGMGTGDRVVW